jgi:hypothetical protein
VWDVCELGVRDLSVTCVCMTCVCVCVCVCDACELFANDL